MLVTSSAHGSVVVVTLNRDEKRNALSTELIRELGSALDDAQHSARAIVLTGAGSVFSAGADLDENEFQGSFFDDFFTVIRALRTAAAPIIAHVNGPAIGAGMMLTMACDIRVAAHSARFSLPVGDMAIGVNEWVVRTLTELLGGSRARAMLLAGAPLDVDTAVASGYATAGSFEQAMELAELVAGKAPLTLRNVKAEFAPDLFTAAEREAALRAPFESDDIKEVGRARSEGRPVLFRGL
ncbi:enoyl-CoA hydratase-related protein [Corynebacterium sanguinis]|uniref:enoyl-CoA hydratase-related protein n=1 Tax=Corynebacterium sanguinis TaxID=2594913 RepID=UPI0021BD6111|nr:enoyl-CoA hydratase-related protein [Corynebacterium sanguinis]